MSVITYPLNGINYDATNIETYMCGRSSGVFATTDNFAVSCTGEDRIVTIGTGLAWVKDGDFAGKSICSTEETEIQLSTAPSGNSRYDRIVLRFDKSGTTKKSYFTKIEGTAAASPTAPAIVRDSNFFDLGLYLIYRGAGTTVVSASDIQNTMADETVCGVMANEIDGIPTSAIYEKFDALYNTLKTQLENLKVDVIPAQDVSFSDTSAELGASTAQAAIEALKTLHDETQAELDAFEENKAFTLLGTYTAGGSVTYSNADGYKDILLEYSGSYLEAAQISLNGSSTTATVYNGTSAGSSITYTGKLHLTMLGQYCLIQPLNVADTNPNTGSSATYAGTVEVNRLIAAQPRLVQFDSSCAMKKITISTGRAMSTPSGTVKVYAR